MGKGEMQKRLLNVNECSEYLGTTPGTLYQWVSQRRIPFVKIGSSTRFDVQKINQFIQENTFEKKDFLTKP